MESNYKKLGLTADATMEQVEQQYKKLMKIYENQNVAEASQRAYAEKTKQEITEAYKAIVASKSRSFNRQESAQDYDTQTQYSQSTTGEYKSQTAYAQQEMYDEQTDYAYSDKNELYRDVRKLIQNGEYKVSLTMLEQNPHELDGEWNYLMGSALYFSGFVSKSYVYFADAVRLSPSNKEYSAVYNRLKGGRTGRVYNSPYTTKKNKSDLEKACDTPAGILGCIICCICCLD